MAAALACAVLLCLPAAAQQGGPAEGQAFPAVRLTAPEDPKDVAYLGLGPGAKTFAVGDIDAAVVVVQLFNMYCTYCQREAPRVNDLRGLIERQGLGRQIKLIGLGLNNTAMEVDVFRQKFGVVFPLIPDPDGAIQAKLGQTVTPYFVVIDNAKGGRIILAHQGPIASLEDFLAEITRRAGPR